MTRDVQILLDHIVVFDGFKATLLDLIIGICLAPVPFNCFAISSATYDIVYC